MFDLNHYELPDETDYISRMTDIVYVNRVVEGTFFGGIAGCRVNVQAGECGRVHLGVSAMGILKAVSSVNISLGIRYVW